MALALGCLLGKLLKGKGLEGLEEDKVHTCGGPRRRPGLGEGRGRRIYIYIEIVYIIISAGSWPFAGSPYLPLTKLDGGLGSPTPGEVVPAQTQPLATQGDRGDRGDLVPCQQL